MAIPSKISKPVVTYDGLVLEDAGELAEGLASALAREHDDQVISSPFPYKHSTLVLEVRAIRPIAPAGDV